MFAYDLLIFLENKKVDWLRVTRRMLMIAVVIVVVVGSARCVHGRLEVCCFWECLTCSRTSLPRSFSAMFLAMSDVSMDTVTKVIPQEDFQQCWMCPWTS